MKINEIMDPKKSTCFLNNALQLEVGEVKMFFVPVDWVEKKKKQTKRNPKPEIVYNLFCIWLHQS